MLFLFFEVNFVYDQKNNVLVKQVVGATMVSVMVHFVEKGVKMVFSSILYEYMQ
jgi:uncharacterized protein YrrD